MGKNNIRLGVNIDHVATIRNARGGDFPELSRAAKIAENSGADVLTVHLREDRRHVKEIDIEKNRRLINIFLSFLENILKILFIINFQSLNYMTI